jgi:hypothetical protein
MILAMENYKPLQRSLFPSLPIPSQDEVIKSLTPQFLYLWHTIRDPWDEFLEYRANDRNFQDFTEEETAYWMTIQSAHRAKQFFDGRKGVRILTRHRKLVLLFDEKLAVTIKKLTKRRKRRGQKEHLTRSNNLTKANKNYWNQQRTEPEVDMPRVILGYQLLKEITEIKILIAYARTTQLGVEWAYEIPAQIPITTPVEPRILVGEDDTAQKGFTIEAAETVQQTADGDAE